MTGGLKSLVDDQFFDGAKRDLSVGDLDVALRAEIRAQLAELIDHIRTTGAKAIFLETGTNPQLAEQVAQETGSKVVTNLYSHSITGPSGPAPTYIDMMKFNTNSIVDALK